MEAAAGAGAVAGTSSSPPAAGASSLHHELPIVALVGFVLGLQPHQLLIEVAGVLEIALLNRSVRHQFQNLGTVSGVACLLQNLLQVFQRLGIFTQWGDAALELFNYLAGEQRAGEFRKKLKRLGQAMTGNQVVAAGGEKFGLREFDQQLFCDRHRLFNEACLQINLGQQLQPGFG